MTSDSEKLGPVILACIEGAIQNVRSGDSGSHSNLLVSMIQNDSKAYPVVTVITSFIATQALFEAIGVCVLRAEDLNSGESLAPEDPSDKPALQ